MWGEQREAAPGQRGRCRAAAAFPEDPGPEVKWFVLCVVCFMERPQGGAEGQPAADYWPACPNERASGTTLLRSTGAHVTM